MKNLTILYFEIIVAALFVIFGLSGHKILFLQGARSATIVFGIFGMLLCTMSVGKFVSAAPAHPLSILGYLFGTVALMAFLTQVFKWNLPLIGQPKLALVTLAVSMVLKGVIARFDFLITK